MSSETEHVNPFAAPLETDSPAADIVGADLSDAEGTRNELLSTEASIKSIGTIYLMTGGLWVVGGVMMFIGEFAEANFIAANNQPVASIIAVVIAGLGAVSIWCAFGLYRLDPTIRVWVLVLQSICLVLHLVLVDINLLTIGISIYVLVVMSGQKGRRVLSSEYQQVVAATPHIKRKTSIVVWILLALLLGVLALAIGGAFFVGAQGP